MFVPIALLTSIASVLACSDKYKFEFDMMDVIDVDYSKFEKINFSKDTCEYLRYPITTSKMTASNFTCSIDECVKWCEYDANCMFSVYSPGICTKSTNGEISDNYDASNDFFRLNTTVYMKKTQGRIRYFSQLCYPYVSKRACNSNKQCRWMKGKHAYNAEHIVLKSTWCGRVKCTK